MKSIVDIISEMDGAATPASTMGMGNPMPAGQPGSPGVPGEPGSEPICAKCKTEKKKKKKVSESLLDDEDTIMADALKSSVKQWLLDQNCDKNHIRDFWEIKDDGTLSLKLKQYVKHVVFELKTNTPFPGKWADLVPAFILSIPGDVDWKGLNLPEHITKLTVKAQSGKINLEGLKLIDGSCQITIYSDNVSSIVFDPALVTQELYMDDWRDGNIDYGKVIANLPKKVKLYNLPRCIASSLLSKKLKANISIH